MATTHIKMVDVSHCLICGKYIGKGNDPAVCSESCDVVLQYECNFNKWAKQQAGKATSQQIGAK